MFEEAEAVEPDANGFDGLGMLALNV